MKIKVKQFGRYNTCDKVSHKMYITITCLALHGKLSNILPNLIELVDSI